jgi:hypothetical protein
LQNSRGFIAFTRERHVRSSLQGAEASVMVLASTRVVSAQYHR